MSNLNENFETMFNKMENFVSTKTVVGEPLKIGDITLIPIVDVTFGLGAGSRQRRKKAAAQAADWAQKSPPQQLWSFKTARYRYLMSATRPQ